MQQIEVSCVFRRNGNGQLRLPKRIRTAPGEYQAAVPGSGNVERDVPEFPGGQFEGAQIVFRSLIGPAALAVTGLLIPEGTVGDGKTDREGFQLRRCDGVIRCAAKGEFPGLDRRVERIPENSYGKTVTPLSE